MRNKKHIKLSAGVHPSHQRAEEVIPEELLVGEFVLADKVLLLLQDPQVVQRCLAVRMGRAVVLLADGGTLAEEGVGQGGAA